MKKIGIIDYGAGNLASLKNALKKIGEKPAIVKRPCQIDAMDGIIVPGVGNFGAAMESLRVFEKGLKSYKKPILGICLGLQVFYEGSEESPGITGMAFYSGKCKRFPAGELKVPHMGWNNIQIIRKCPLVDGLTEKDFFYFVHSFYGEQGENTIAETEYGVKFSAITGKDDIFATQFHPEKSGEPGLLLLKNFVGLL